jgi:hypothetical protein
MVVLSTDHGFYIVGGYADAAAMAPDRLGMVGNGRTRFQIFHEDLRDVTTGNHHEFAWGQERSELSAQRPAEPVTARSLF